jgi:tRNA (guanine-N7-)-methyltransferase
MFGVMETSDKNADFAQRRLYGRSKGKALRRRQCELLDDLLPTLSCDFSAPLPSAAALFAEKKSETWLEIGFGGGEHLAELAKTRPEVGFLGCEPFVNGMAQLLAKIAENRLTNIRLHLGDAMNAIAALPDASVDRVYLLYPDPWPKRRHRKRRFVSDESLSELARIMKRGAELRFATDIDDYAGWTLARIAERKDFLWKARSAQDWRAPWDGWTPTKYERKAMAAARRPVYLTFARG